VGIVVASKGWRRTAGDGCHGKASISAPEPELDLTIGWRQTAIPLALHGRRSPRACVPCMRSCLGVQISCPAGPAALPCRGSWMTGDSPVRDGTPPFALRQDRRRSRRWTREAGGASAAMGGSNGGNAGTGHSGSVGSGRTWPGTRASRPTGRGAGAAARHWRLPCQDSPWTGWASHASISALVVDAPHRTAGYVPRMSGGVGGAPCQRRTSSRLQWRP
jgi:hypothetical protein